MGKILIIEDEVAIADLEYILYFRLVVVIIK